MTTEARRQAGFLTAELAVATGLLGLLIAGMAVSLGGFSALNRYLWTRQRCTAAAQAQLDSLVATGRPIEPQELKRLWPEVDVSLDIKIADGGLGIANSPRPGDAQRGAPPRPESAIEPKSQLARPEADVAPEARSGASWEGLKRVEVTAAAPVGARLVKIRLVRYVQKDD